MSGIVIQRGGAGGFTGGMSNLGNSSGTSGTIASQLLLAGGNNITLSQSVNGQSATITISGANIPAQTVESQTLGISNLGNTAGTSGVVSAGQVRVLFAGGNNVTLSQSTNGASATITISGANIPAQTVESNTLGISNLGNTSGTSGVVSGGQLQLILAGGNNVTLSQSTNGASATITISAFNQTVESNTFGISNLGNTSGTSGVVSAAQVRVLFAGGNNITLSQSTNGASATITISAPNQSVESQSIGMSNLGNTSGTSGMASGGQVQFVFAGGNNVTLSQSLNGASGTITISAFTQTVQTQGFINNISVLGNTAGTISAGTGSIALAGGNYVTLSGSTAAGAMTITVVANEANFNYAFQGGF
jgi:hypothetical protein